MNIEKWLAKNTSSLKGKVVAITGSTGGLGTNICWYLARLGASILTLDRNPTKSLALKNELLQEFPDVDIKSIRLDLGEIQNVKDVCAQLANQRIDYLILNAGIYNVPISVGDTGYNNVFQVNFVSPYYLVKALLPTLQKYNGRVIAVSSIAHKFAKLNERDVDYSHVKKSSKIYGNSKRFLLFSLYELLQDKLSFVASHPGITLTNMTNHYPKAINWFVKFGIKVVFPSPRQAASNIISALFNSCGYHEWIGPKQCNIWGKPNKKKLNTCKPPECGKIYQIAESIYDKVSM